MPRVKTHLLLGLAVRYTQRHSKRPESLLVSVTVCPLDMGPGSMPAFTSVWKAVAYAQHQPAAFDERLDLRLEFKV